MKRFLVYQATLPDGRIYIGRTTCLLARQYAHNKNAMAGRDKNPFHAAIREFGNVDNVTWTVLYKDLSKQEAKQYEAQAIFDAYQKHGNLVFNINSIRQPGERDTKIVSARLCNQLLKDFDKHSRIALPDFIKQKIQDFINES